MSSKTRIVFVDRDGTINQERGFVYRLEDFQFIESACEALKLLSENGILIYIVTNQSGIARGYYTEEDFHKLTGYMMKHFRDQSIKVEAVLYCPHHPEAVIREFQKVCNCRKPATGHIESVIKKYSVDPSDIAIIGDRECDVEAGRRLGIRTYLVETGYGKQCKETTNADYIFPDLMAVVKHLLNDWARG